MNDKKSDGTLAAADCGLFLLRIGVAGLMLTLHGWARFFRASEYLVFGTPWPFVDLVAGLGFPVPGAFAVMSALSESIGAVLMAMGWLTRWAALALVIDMSVALFNEGSKGDPIELPALYLVGALTLMITGPGRFALDRWQRAERRPTMSKVHSPNAASI
ncbi:MAG: DoxX family protein [Vicinamibacterales bacterium]